MQDMCNSSESLHYFVHEDSGMHSYHNTCIIHSKFLFLCINEIFVVVIEHNMFYLYCNTGYGGSAVERPSSVIAGLNPA